jgi:hypothetical protein
VFLTGNERPECLGDRKTFSDWSVDEIHYACVLVHRKPSNIVRSTAQSQYNWSSKLAAFAVSITLPPPTLYNKA